MPLGVLFLKLIGLGLYLCLRVYIEQSIISILEKFFKSKMNRRSEDIFIIRRMKVGITLWKARRHLLANF